MKKLTLLLFVVMLLTACGPAPQDVVNSWQDALNRGDIEAALSYLADDALVTISPAGPEGDAVFTGHGEIRGWYEILLGGKGVTTLSDCKIDGETISCLDTYSDEGLKVMGIDFIEGQWVGVVRDGKIQSYTFTMSPESLAKLPPPPVESVPATAVPAASVVEFPIGTFTNSNLAWTWEFKADGSYSSQGLQARESGTYSVTGDQISLKGDYCGSLVGIYTWTYDGKALKFTAIDDKCYDRTGVVIDGRWVQGP